MESARSQNERATKVLRVVIIASLLSLTMSAPGRAAEPVTPASKQPTPAGNDTRAATQPPDVLSREAWHSAMSRISVPKTGCFKSSYPKLAWEEVPCTTAPLIPYPPARGPRLKTVGNGTDFTAVTSGPISSAVGSFDSVSGVTSVRQSGTEIVNRFSIQLNTNRFTTPACSNSPGCQGWQQFVYSNAGFAIIQYWMIGFNNRCPSGWNTQTNRSGNDCWRNGENSAAVPVQKIDDLVQLRLRGQVNAGGTDTIIFSTATGDLNAANQDSILNVAGNWNGAEFNIVGDGNLSAANFNLGVTIVVRISVVDGTSNAPSCATTGFNGFTGEANNLNLVPPCCPRGGSLQGVAFMQSNAGTTSSCSPDGGIGDPHLTAFWVSQMLLLSH